MKKLALLACVMTITTGMAVAQQTVSIPFFADTNGVQSFVGIQNTGSASVVVALTYNTTAGTTSGGTFGLAPNESVSFRPFATTGDEVQKHATESPVGFGSITMATDGGTVAGRYVQISAGGSFAYNVEIN
jgi:hypothetical protein